MLSEARCNRIKSQGYQTGFSDEEISQLAVGNRFAYQLCTVLLVIGLVLTSIPVLIAAAVIALLAVVLPQHPFDYLFNYGVRYLLNKPEQPPRSAQSRFACGMAALWIGAIIYLFSLSLFVWGYVLGGVLFFIALLVSTIDFCIPSLIYNRLFQRS